MKIGKRAATAAWVTGVVAAATVALPPTAGAADDGPSEQARVITRKLDGPFGLAKLGRGFVVAENVSGEVTWVGRRGGQRVLVKNAAGVAGVATAGSRVYSVLGADDEDPKTPAGAYPATSVLRTNVRTGRTTVIANLMRYELRNNPDGQVQFVGGKPVDALSNPFAMTSFRRGLLVADGGGNDVLLVNRRTGRVRTFFVPPLVKDVPGCGENNPGTTGCDSVPTGVTVAHGSVYVSTLGAHVPGAGRIYKLSPRGKVQRVWKGLASPTGIAVGRDRSVYFSQVEEGAPQGEGPPPAGFDPASVGQITRVANGKMTAAQVTMPTGLLIRNGRLYASTWSIASFLGIQHAGRVEQVERWRFR
jgi:hypothetical protein